MVAIHIKQSTEWCNLPLQTKAKIHFKCRLTLHFSWESIYINPMYMVHIHKNRKWGFIYRLMLIKKTVTGSSLFKRLLLLSYWFNFEFKNIKTK